VPHSSSVFLRGSDASGEDFDQRFRLTKEWIDLGRREKWDAMNQAEPAARFADFFQTNAEFVNEISAGFRALQLAMICEWRCSTSEKLICHMPPRPRSRQRIDQSNNPNRVLQQPLFKVKSPPTRYRGALLAELDVGRWTLDVGRSAFRPLAEVHAWLFLNASVSFHQYVSVIVKIPL
jgi:hypothetical protein